MTKRWHDRGTKFAPAVSINQMVFKGQINPDNVFEALCAGFDQMPSGCTKWLEKEGIHIPGKQTGVSTKTLLLIIAVVLSINLVLGLAYRNRVQKELKADMKV